MKLAAKIMLVFLALVMVWTAAGSYFTVRRGFERFEARQRRAAREAADAMDEQLNRAWKQDGLDGLVREMETAAKPPHQRMRWVWFEQVQGTGKHPQVTIVEKIRFDDGEAISRTVLDSEGKRQLRTYYPIDLGNGPRGGLEVSESLAPLDDETRETITGTLFSLGLMALASFGLVYFVGVRWVARPLEGLIAKTEQIGQGNFAEPLEVHGNDELSQLARALNAMSDKLAAQQQRIHEETADRLTTLEQLRHADRLKTVGRLAAGIAHEMGTPLNVVSGRAGLIASGKLSDDDVAASAATIKSEADRITSIIRQLLDFARPSASQRARVDVPALAQQTIELIEPIAEKRNVHVTFSPAQDIAISGDRGQLQQVFTNLLVNAIHSMPQGGNVTVTVEKRRATPPEPAGAAEGDYVSVAIQDAGTGIAPEVLEQIFEPFFTTKDVGEGTGLGLSIAYGIVREHGGWIDVESEPGRDGEPGRGSCFTVYLPQE